MVEALVALGAFGNVGLGDVAVELAGQPRGIDHLTLGVTRVYTDALNGDLSGCGIEVLIFQVADVAAVHGVSPVAAELLHIEVVGTHANLLVGVEGDADVAMLDFVVVAQVAHGLHNLGNTGLVVGAEQCGAVGDDEVFALVSQQFREFLG